jgi:putative membrane protein
MTTPATTPPPTATANRVFAVPSFLFNVVRGALIGLAELVPGISGGTVALITGVYERLIDSAAAIVSAVKRLLFGPDRRKSFAAEVRLVEWWLVIPVLVGMVTVVLLLAGFVEALVSGNPELSRGLFFGLVAASIIVPLQLIPRARRTVADRIGGVALFVAAAFVAFASVDLVGSALVVDPPLWLVFVAAAIAVCALVIPGVSGSFFLLAIGLYSPTLRAVAERDMAYLAVFAAGALVGLVTIVRVMKWLLETFRRLTLIAMAGLMLGSLRALWPWQELPAGSDHGVGTAVAPYDPIAGPILLALLGASMVIALIIVERVIQRRQVAALAANAPELDRVS